MFTRSSNLSLSGEKNGNDIKNPGAKPDECLSICHSYNIYLLMFDMMQNINITPFSKLLT